MKILYSHRIQSRDGQSVHVEELVAALRGAGHDVLVVGPGFYERSKFGGESGTVARWRAFLPKVVAELAELAYNIVAFWRLWRVCQVFQPDLLYERYNLYYFGGTLLARSRRMLFYLEVNSPLAEERARFGGLRLKRLARASERYVWRSADRVLAVTGVLRDRIAAAGVTSDRISVTPNGINLRGFPVRARDNGSATSVCLGFVGFLRSWHGLESVIRQLAGHSGTPSLHMLVVGDGPVREQLQELSAQLGIADRVRFTGLATREEVLRLLNEVDIALQPSAVPYASPLKIFEYMGAGLAIVAPDQPNIREILVHEHTAMLFNPASNTDMWRQVIRLTTDYELRQRIGKAARAKTEECDYTWQGNARRIIELAQQDLHR
jgi:glycosyltransferase involved in cell wall biosynthesis